MQIELCSTVIHCICLKFDSREDINGQTLNKHRSTYFFSLFIFERPIIIVVVNTCSCELRVQVQHCVLYVCLLVLFMCTSRSICIILVLYMYTFSKRSKLAREMRKKTGLEPRFSSYGRTAINMHYTFLSRPWLKSVSSGTNWFPNFPQMAWFDATEFRFRPHKESIYTLFIKAYYSCRKKIY